MPIVIDVEQVEPLEQPSAPAFSARPALPSTLSLSPGESISSMLSEGKLICSHISGSSHFSLGWSGVSQGTESLQSLLPADDPHTAYLYFEDIFKHNRRFEVGTLCKP